MLVITETHNRRGKKTLGGEREDAEGKEKKSRVENMNMYVVYI
jgi:hypothetical protein